MISNSFDIKYLRSKFTYVVTLETILQINNLNRKLFNISKFNLLRFISIMIYNNHYFKLYNHVYLITIIYNIIIYILYLQMYN